jgi:hypothetical protein
LAERVNGPRTHFDIIIEGYVRADVKTAHYAEYGKCRGWFYRVGKMVSADLLMLYQSDTKEVYYIPWGFCPSSNITISRDGGKYKFFRNNIEILEKMIAARREEAYSILKSIN